MPPCPEGLLFDTPSLSCRPAADAVCGPATGGSTVPTVPTIPSLPTMPQEITTPPTTDPSATPPPAVSEIPTVPGKKIFKF